MDDASFSVLYYSKLNMFGFWNIAQNKNFEEITLIITLNIQCVGYINFDNKI